MKLQSFLFFSVLLICLTVVSSCTLYNSNRLFNDGIQDLHQQRYKDSVSALLLFVQKYPNDILSDDALFLVANIDETYLFDRTKAIQTYRVILQKFPNSKYYSSSLVSLFRIYISNKQGDMRKIALLISRLYLKLHEQTQNDPKNQYLLEQEYIKAKEYEKARIMAKQMYLKTTKKEWKERAYYLIGFSYLKEHKIGMAMATVRELKKKYKKTLYAVPIILQIGDIYEKQGNLVQAAKIYQEVLDTVEEQNIYYQLTYERINRLHLRMRYTNEE